MPLVFCTQLFVVKSTKDLSLPLVYIVITRYARQSNQLDIQKFRLFMPMIRVQDWTKEQLEEIKDEEDHTSLDSVIKSLLKERGSTADSINK